MKSRENEKKKQKKFFLAGATVAGKGHAKIFFFHFPDFSFS